MAVVPGGRPAVTHYRVLERFAAHTLLAVKLETGRTHQIRVHMAYIRHPLVGDQTYGGRPRPPKNAGRELTAGLQAFPRQCLHAIALGLCHPDTGKEMLWEIPMAEDIDALLELLRERSAHGSD
jgi:23S rRNA pseudouridine1911/1915/1917 synthase